MSIPKKVVTLCLGLVLLATAGMAACQTSPTTDTSPITKTPLTSQEILSNTLRANTTVQTVKFSGNTTVTVEVTGGTYPSMKPTARDFDVQLDNGHKAFQMTQTVDPVIVGTPRIYYIVDGLSYINYESRVEGGEWKKLKINQVWAGYNEVEQQMKFLKTTANVTLQQDENVGGIDCYVLVVNPDMKVLTNWVLQQDYYLNLLGRGPGSSGNLIPIDLAGMFKIVSIKQWIAKDTYLIVRTDIQAVLEMSPRDIRANDGDFEKMTVEVKGKCKFFDYNQPITIELPEAARSATTIPTLPD